MKFHIQRISFKIDQNKVKFNEDKKLFWWMRFNIFFSIDFQIQKLLINFETFVCLLSSQKTSGNFTKEFKPWLKKISNYFASQQLALNRIPQTSLPTIRLSSLKHFPVNFMHFSVKCSPLVVFYSFDANPLLLTSLSSHLSWIKSIHSSRLNPSSTQQTKSF